MVCLTIQSHYTTNQAAWISSCPCMSHFDNDNWQFLMTMTMMSCFGNQSWGCLTNWTKVTKWITEFYLVFRELRMAGWWSPVNPMVQSRWNSLHLQTWGQPAKGWKPHQEVQPEYQKKGYSAGCTRWTLGGLQPKEGSIRVHQLRDVEFRLQQDTNQSNHVCIIASLFEPSSHIGHMVWDWE